MEEVVILSGVRTPIGSFGGSLQAISPVTLAQVVITEAVRRARIDGSVVDKVIFGNCFAPLDQNLARIAGFQAGLPQEVPAFTVNCTCGSSLQAIISATQAIQSGEADVVLAGGAESMSRAPYIDESARWGQRLKHVQIQDLLWRGMQEYPIGVGMGLTAENLVERDGISRADQDDFALQSQQRAARAVELGLFKDETIAVSLPTRGGDVRLFEVDEQIRTDLDLESLKKQQPAFKKGGTVTPGNSCSMNDGAAAIVLASRSAAQRLGVTPLARVKGYNATGVNPDIMGIGPVPSIRTLLQKIGCDVADVDRYEINEAFAAQYLACERALGLDRAKVNVRGGAIALGHPVGATGCRLLVSVLHSLIQEGLGLGVASLCAGGGMGFSVAVEQC